MRILVTGANGQLGNEMQVLAKENPQHTYYFTDVAGARHLRQASRVDLYGREAD